MIERTAGAILEKRLRGDNPSPLVRDIKSVLDTLGEVSTNLEVLKNGNLEFNTVVEKGLAGVREVRDRVLDRVPQVIWIKTDEADFSQKLKSDPLRRELIGERHELKKIIETEKTKPVERGESKITTLVKFDVEDLEERNEYGDEDGQSLNIYFDDVRKISFNSARNRRHARDILRGELALGQLEKILESGIVTGDVAEEITTLLAQPKAKNLLMNLKNTIKSGRDAAKDKNQGSFLTAKSAARQEKWINKKIKNAGFDTGEEMRRIIVNRVKIAKKALESYDSLGTENLKLAAKWAYKYRGKGLAVADLIGLGNEGLMTAAAKYNYKTGYAFSTYAVWWIRQSISRGIAETGTTIRLPVHIHETLSKMTTIQQDLTRTLEREPTSLEIAGKAGLSASVYNSIMNAKNMESLNQIIGDKENMELGDNLAKIDIDYAGLTYKQELKEVVNNALSHLEKRERQVVELRFGIGRTKGGTLAFVGNELGVTRERARQIEAKALRKLNEVLKTYVFDMRSNLLQHRRDAKEQDEVNDTRDIRVVKSKEVVERKPPKVNVTAVKIDTDKKESVGKIIGISREPLQISKDSKTTEYCGPSEILSTLEISRQRWHQMKGDYRYKSIKIGKTEHILREDLMVIKALHDIHRHHSRRLR